VDVSQDILVIGPELHAEGETFLIDMGSKQEDLWGINLYPESEILIEFDSMINIRPGQGNRSRNVENLKVQEKIKGIVYSLVE
jgi:hypothetical protein